MAPQVGRLTATRRLMRALYCEENLVVIASLDHFVLTVRRIDDTVRFYTDVLGMESEVFGEGRILLLQRSGSKFN